MKKTQNLNFQKMCVVECILDRIDYVINGGSNDTLIWIYLFLLT